MRLPLRSAGFASVAVFVAVLAWLAASAWARPLWLPDEGRYVGVAWEMLRSGHWLTPTLDGLPYFHKPPLFYWLTAASMAVWGPSVFAARVAPLLGAALAAVALYAFVRRWCGVRQARLTLVALTAQPLFFIGGQFANLDMLVAGCITATVLLLAHAALAFEQGSTFRVPLLGGYAAAAVGVLAKGLIGVVLPLLVVAAWLLLRRRWRCLWAMLSVPGAALFLLLAAPWFVAMQRQYPDFLHYFFVVQHFKRFAGGGFNNVHPFWFYPVALALFCLPWLPWLGRCFERSRWAAAVRDPVRLLMLLWIVLLVLFFSVPASKPLGYILPVVPPLAFFFADGYLAYGRSPRARTRWVASVAVSVVVGLGAVAWVALRPPHSTRALALALASQVRAGDQLLMLDRYYFDLPFYLRRPPPVAVIDQWDSADIPRNDNARKELADAGHFDAVGVASTLLLPSALAARLHAAPTTWLIGPDDAVGRYPVLAKATQVSSHDGSTLWRFDADSSWTVKTAPAAERPNGGSAGK